MFVGRFQLLLTKSWKRLIDIVMPFNDQHCKCSSAGYLCLLRLLKNGKLCQQELKSNWSFCLKITTKLLQRSISYIYKLQKYSVSTYKDLHGTGERLVHVTFKFGAQCFNHKQMQVSKIQEHFGRKAFKTSSGSIWALVTNMLAHNYG